MTSPLGRFPAALVAVLVASTALVAAPTHARAQAPTQAAAAAPQAPVERQRVKVLQYNIRFGQLGLDGVARDIRRTGAQVVLLNEVDDRRPSGGVHQPRYLAEKLGMRWVFDPNSRNRLGFRGNAVLTSFDTGSAKRYALPEGAGTEPRGLMRVRIKTGATRLDVWTTHLTPARTEPKARVRLAQARTVRRTIGDPTCTTILGGDMNAGATTPDMAALRTHLEDLWRRKGDGPGGTTRNGGARIDYLYFAQAGPRSVSVTPPRHSDHRGLVGVFDLNPARAC